MSYIEELRQRVESAERRFGLIDEQERRYSERLITLMKALETAQTENQTEAAVHQARIAELERENGELRGMLHALLLGVEAGGRDALAGTLRDLDSRLSGLVSVAPAPAEDVVAIEVVELEAMEGEPEASELDPETLADETPAAEDIMAEDLMAEAPMAEEAAAEDPVAAAEEAVTALVGDDPMGDEIVADLDEMAMEEMAEPASDESAEDAAHNAEAEEHPGNMPPSPVAEMIVRLAEETQYFPEPEVEGDAAPEAPAPKAKPSRKKA